MCKLTCKADDIPLLYLEWRREGDDGEMHERFGQWLWNRHGKLGETWPELFYEQSWFEALGMAYLHCQRSEEHEV